MSPDDEWKKRLNDRYEASRSDFKGSRGFAKWKALEPATRRYIVAGVVIVVIIIAIAIWGSPVGTTIGEGM